MQRNRKRRYSRSRWELTRERLHIRDSAPPAGEMELHRLGEAIPGLMKKLGMEEAHWIGTLSEEWASLMGSAVAAHTRPGELSNKRLTVYVDSSVWLYELTQTGRTSMLENLDRRYGAGKIRDIRFQLDPDS